MKSVSKFIYYIILFGVLLGGMFLTKFYFINSTNVVNKICEVEYSDYEKERDFNDIDDLMMRYKFWIFHGDFKAGECPLYPNFKNMSHKNDFDATMQVPYFIKVARVDGKCVGFLTYYFSENTMVGKKGQEIKKIGRVHVLCVDEKFRRLGIAKKLVEFAIDFFKINGCQRVYLITRPENIRAKNLYHKLGFFESNNDEKNVFDLNPADVLIKDL